MPEGADATLPPEVTSPLPDTTITPPPFAGDGSDGEGGVGDVGAEEVPVLDPQDGEGKRFSKLAVSHSEPEPDAETSGVADPYAEAVAIDVEGTGDSLRVRIRFASKLPPKMSGPNTYMVVGFGMSGKRDNEGYAFGAQGSNKGWQPYSGSKNDRSDFPGTFSINGDTFEMTMPWSALGGPRAFEWYSNSSWFRHVAGVTSYSFDLIPNSTGRYPD